MSSTPESIHLEDWIRSPVSVECADVFLVLILRFVCSLNTIIVRYQLPPLLYTLDSVTG